MGGYQDYMSECVWHVSAKSGVMTQTVASVFGISKTRNSPITHVSQLNRDHLSLPACSSFPVYHVEPTRNKPDFFAMWAPSWPELLIASPATRGPKKLTPNPVSTLRLPTHLTEPLISRAHLWDLTQGSGPLSPGPPCLLPSLHPLA